MGEAIPRVAVVTEWHPIDVVAFHRLFRLFDDLDCYIQDLELLAKDEKNLGTYSTIVFYNLSFNTPEPGTEIRKLLEGHLGSTPQGIFLLHHGLLSYEKWELWGKVSGLADRGFAYHQNQTVRFEVTDATHPITRGLKPWTMTDETYTMREPDADSRILLSTSHELSLRAIAWTRQYGASRVFCYASGHDDAAYTDRRFREVVRRGIRWSSGLLGEPAAGA